LLNNTTATYNSAFGFQSMKANISGERNTAVGYTSLTSNTTGSFNTALSMHALYYNTTGSDNTGAGYYALHKTTTGYDNTGIGKNALSENTSGFKNTSLGAHAGDNITTGSSNIIIGSGVDAPSATASNQLNIGGWIKGVDGNIGIGVTPESDWVAGRPSLALGAAAGALSSSTGVNSGQLSLSANAKQTATSNTTGWSYVNSYQASQHHMFQGQHYFKVAPSGTADTAISWTTAMAIDNSSNIQTGGGDGIATVYGSSPSGTFSIKGRSNSGSVGILTLSKVGDTGQILDFRAGSTLVGSVSVSASATEYNTSSDYRLKELDVPMEGSIDRLKLLRPINFAWKVDGSRVDGFLAHEAQEVVPEAVTGTKDAMMDEEYEVTPAVMDGDTVVTEAVMGTRSVPDYQGIDQSKLVPLLVASLQEAIARIEVLENA